MLILHHGLSSGLQKCFNVSARSSPLQNQPYFPFYPWLWCLTPGLCSDVLLVPGIYVETCAYNNVYLRVFDDVITQYTLSQSQVTIYWALRSPIFLYPRTSQFFSKLQHRIRFILERYFYRASKKQSHYKNVFGLIMKFSDHPQSQVHYTYN